MRRLRPSTPPTATATWATASCSSGWRRRSSWPTNPRPRRSSAHHVPSWRRLPSQPRPGQSPPLPAPGSVVAGRPGRHRPRRDPRRPHGLPHRSRGGGRVPAPAVATAQLSPPQGRRS
jgi:hypothetical protein